MDNLRTGEKIAGASGVALLLIMFIFDWFTVADDRVRRRGRRRTPGTRIGGSTRFILLPGGARGHRAGGDGAHAVPGRPAGRDERDHRGPWRPRDAPDHLPDHQPARSAALGDLVDVGRSIGVFLGLIAAAGVAYGGWTAMQEEGTSFADQADRLGGGGDDAPPPPPPPPPPPAQRRVPRRRRSGISVSKTAASGRPSSFRPPRAPARPARAIAMIVIIGFTPIELGNRLPSAT